MVRPNRHDAWLYQTDMIFLSPIQDASAYLLNFANSQKSAIVGSPSQLSQLSYPYLEKRQKTELMKPMETHNKVTSSLDAIAAMATNVSKMQQREERKEKKVRKKTNRRTPESKLTEKKKFEEATKNGTIPSAKNVTHRVKDSMWNVYAKVDSNTRIHVADFPRFDDFAGEMF